MYFLSCLSGSDVGTVQIGTVQIFLSCLSGSDEVGAQGVA